ncbi:MAG: hypothetical protein ACR2Q3_04460 [Woeseiaceae bacterium]
MKLSSFQIGAISSVTAVVLWLIATLFEDDSRWRLSTSEPSVAADLSATRGDTPVRTATDILSCQQTEAALQSRVDSARVCSTNDDCTLFDYGYPIECMTSVSVSDISALRLQYRRYEESCAYRVYYDCPSGDMDRVPVCRNNRCEVELTTIHPLQDETLQHLGLKDL